MKGEIMKIRTRLIIAAVFALLALMLVSCEKDKVSITYGEDGSYLGFSDIPSDYTAASAAADGCLVIDTVQGKNEYGATITEKRETDGYENWKKFIKRTESGKDAFLRVAHFIDGIGYYHDLYYCDGKYTIFENNEYGISEGETFKYLRRLVGLAGPASDPKEDCFYVLTDSMELTYRDVSWSFLSSDHTTVTKIPFEWLGFMIYFE